MLGTLVNTIAVLAGSALGLALHRRLSQDYTATMMQAVGLFTLVIGFQLVTLPTQPLIVLLAVVSGGLIGEVIGIEGGLQRLGKWVQSRFSGGPRQGFVPGFVTASLLFCVGPMTVVGCLEDGLRGNHTLLFTKSLMDGISSVALASSFGLGVTFSAAIVLVYQGLLTLAAVAFRGLLDQSYLNIMSATGGLLVLGIGVNILGAAKIKVANLLPAIALAPLMLKITALLHWVN